MSRVQSIERAFAVLSALADGPIGVTEVAERARLPKSTAARLLSSLSREGAVEQVPGDTRYRLGPRIATLAEGVVPVRSLVATARPILEELAATTGETTGLSVAEGFVVHYVDQVGTSHQVQVRDWTGTRVPMHAVSSGLVFLAQLPAASLEAYLARELEAFTPRTLTAPSALRERLAEVRADGYAWVHEEFAEGLSSVAAAVADASGSIAAAVHVHGPAYRFPTGREQEIGEIVLAGATRVSERLRRSA
ncbi:MAG TPA: IclR family transcriptional regulator [Candidatus Limnocylindrales bacterium]|nr:IclR family transcriptional regulator [Candidatus Limnocylindrales bacterium]